MRKRIGNGGTAVQSAIGPGAQLVSAVFALCPAELQMTSPARSTLRSPAQIYSS